MRTLLFIILSALCSLSVSGQVTAGFTVDLANGCAPHVASFTNTSTGATSYSWNLGNGTITPLVNPSTSYLSVGTYTVVLTATNGTVTSTFTRVITVHPAPTVVFTASDTTVCPGTPVGFTNSSISGVPGPMTYFWNFGDGTTATGPSPIHSYNTSGYYNVTLTVTNSQGCLRSLTRSGYIRVYVRPSANFVATPTSICSPPGDVSFINFSSGTPTLSYLWSFGTGGTSTATAPTHTYATPGLYTVRLTVIDGNGCRDSLIRPSYIFVGVVTASYTAPSAVCVYNNVNFGNTSAPHSTRTWNYGDGTTDTTFNGSHTYSTPGTYTVTLTISNGFCTDIETRTIIVRPQPTADFSCVPVHPCPAPISISYPPTVPPGSTVLWEYEGGAIGTGIPGSHYYATNGVKTIKMIVTDPSGCIDTVEKKDTIYDLHLEAFGVPNSGCVPLTVGFHQDAYTWQPDSIFNIYPYPITGYVWDYGDGSPTTFGPSPTHTYTAVGTYVATLTATTSNGCTVVDTASINVGSPPIVTFTAAPTHICYGDSVVFTATIVSGPVSVFEWHFGDGTMLTSTTTAIYRYNLPGLFTVSVTPYYNGCPGPPYSLVDLIRVDSPKAIIHADFMCTPLTRVVFGDSSLGDDTHLWIFGDGTTSTADHPVHDYPTVGTYTVSLATHNIASGCRDTAVMVINFVSPIVSFVADDTTVCQGDIINFTTTVTGGTVSDFVWLINGVTRPWKVTQNLTDTFNVAGIYTIQLAYKNQNGCFDTITRENYITVGKPVANFTAAPVPGCWPLTVTFTDISTDVPGVTLSSFNWDFGDGNTAIVFTPITTHTYTVAGFYNVTEIVTDNIGCMDTVNRDTAVIVYRPTASFTATETHPCIGEAITFNNTSVGAVSAYWQFGDGTTSTAMAPTHTYYAIGNYTVRLVVTDIHGCTDTATYTTFINITKPTAAFTVSDSVSVCAPLPVTFTNGSTGAFSYSWTFGDGNVSALLSPSNNYISPGLYTSMLIATDFWGCSDTAVRTINIYGYAGALTYTPLTGCAPLTVYFHADISNVPHIIWDFGDGTTSVATATDSATHTYTIPGAYVPKLILSDNTGCQSSSIGTDTIKVDGITAKFGVWPAACIGSEFYFIDSSTALWSPVNSRTWTYGGITTTVDSPTHIVFAAGTYPVILQVSNGWGCTATLNGELVVLPLPVVTTSKDTVVCVGDAASLMGYGANTYSWGPPGTLGCINCNPAPATPLVPSTYSVIGTDVKGCKDTAFVSVGHRTHTIAAAWGDTAICFGQEVAIFDTGGHTYVWTPPMGLSNNTIFNPMASPGSSTTYTVVAQLGTCIPDTDYVHVEVYSLPKVDAGPDQEVLAGTPVQLNATGFNTVTYVWSPSTGLSCFNCPNPEAIVSVTTTYVVTGTSQFGCKHSDSMTVYLFCNNSQVFMPNTFTPNADGENDVFYPRGVGIELVSAFRIYNRWGELLFERKNINLNDASNAWDGSYNDGEPRPDVYVYVVQATCTNGQPLLIKGDVTIVR